MGAGWGGVKLRHSTKSSCSYATSPVPLLFQAEKKKRLPDILAKMDSGFESAPVKYAGTTGVTENLAQLALSQLEIICNVRLVLNQSENGKYNRILV